MSSRSPLDPQEVLGLSREQMPRHIAIIMDGNGRWASQRGEARIVGHQHGAESVRKVVTRSARLGIEALTLYSFSSENWKRPQEEVNALMALYAHYLVAEREEIMENGIRLRQIGRRAGLPEGVVRALDETESMSSGNTGLTLCLALNYGSRAEIVDGVRSIAARVKRGELDPSAIDEAEISASLGTAGLPDPDLVIRTAGELRLSNFLLWQISYAELYVTPMLWPDFGEKDLDRAIQGFARRERRFGAVLPEAGEMDADT